MTKNETNFIRSSLSKYKTDINRVNCNTKILYAKRSLQAGKFCLVYIILNLNRKQILREREKYNIAVQGQSFETDKRLK